MAIKQWLRWLRSHFLDFRVGLVPKGLIHVLRPIQSPPHSLVHPAALGLGMNFASSIRNESTALRADSLQTPVLNSQFSIPN